MRRYEFTERGKIILAVLVVVLLLVIPATVLAIKGAGRTPEPEDSSPPSAYSTETPNVLQTPDIESPDITDTAPEQSPENTPEQTPEQTPAQTPSEQTDEPPVQSEKPSGGNIDPAPAKPASDSGTSGTTLDGGMLSFIFTPSLQTALDSETEALLDSFLKIPDYLPNYQIIAETPKISVNDARTLMRAINSALSNRGIKSSQVEHMSFPPESNGSSFEVKMYFASKKIK